MEDQNILNELLEKIKSMEKSNEILKEKIKKKKEEILNIEKEIKNPNNKEQNKIIVSKKIPTEKEGEIEGLKALQNFKFIKHNTEIKENCKEYTIEYITQEKYNNMYIMGDFTKWELIKMKKIKDIFSYKIILLKGFKYYYSFQSNDQILLDYNAPYEQNPKTLQVQNYIDLNELNKNILFDYNNDMNILKLTEQNYFLSQLNITEDDYLFLYKLKYHGTISKEINNEIKEKKYKIFNSINLYYEQLYKNVNPYNKLNRLLKLYLKNRIISKTFENNITYYYKIYNISDNYIIQSVKLYDNNHIKVNANSYSYNEFYYTILPSQITINKSETNNKLYHLLSLEEGQKILDEYNKDDKSILKAYFKTLRNLQVNNNNDLNEENVFNFRRNMIIVTPQKLEPEGINMDDYEFYYSLNKITKVKNKREGSEVMCTIIDESFEKSKKPTRFEIYYNIMNGKINIIHCHVLDKELRNIKMIIKEINKDEDPHIYKKNEEYIKNNQLLLIIKELDIIKLYYKGKKVKMNKIKIEENKLYLLQSSNPDSIFNKMYVTTQKFEDKIKYDLIEQCNEYTYSLDNLQNGVDIQVTFDNQQNYVLEQMMLSVSPCLLKIITAYVEHLLKQKLPKKKEENKNIFNDMMNEMEKYYIIAQKMVELRKYTNKENINKLTQDEKNKLNKELNEYKNEMQNIMLFIETNEMWENLDEASSIFNEINELIQLLKNQK